MKITDVKFFMVKGKHWPFTFVKIFTDQGIIGFGEATNFPGNEMVLGSLEQMRPLLIGEDPFAVEMIWQKLYRHFYYLGIAGVVITAISGIEIALWDIIGKKLGVPVYNLFGGKCFPKIKLYANGWFMNDDFRYEPDYFAKVASSTVKKGYRALKFDPFVDTSSKDYFWNFPLNRSVNVSGERENQALAIMEAVREAVGDKIEIAIDLHGRFDVPTAIRLCEKFKKYNPIFIEEPIPPENVDAMAKVARESGSPICSGERIFTRHGFRELFEKQAAEVINPDVVRTGGLSETKKIASIAETYYTPITPHNPNAAVGTMASAQVATTCPNFLILELFTFDMVLSNKLVKEPLIIENGYLIFPDKPGLGIELKEEVSD